MCRWQHLSFVSWPATSAGSAATGSARTRWSMPRFSAAGASAGSGHAPTSTGRFGHGLRLPLMLAGATGRCDRVWEGGHHRSPAGGPTSDNLLAPRPLPGGLGNSPRRRGRNWPCMVSCRSAGTMFHRRSETGAANTPDRTSASSSLSIVRRP